MSFEPFDERIVVRVPSDLKRQIQKIAEDEETTVTGAARMLIREGIDSRELIVEMKKRHDRLLEAYISMDRSNRAGYLHLVELCIDITEKAIGEEQGMPFIGYLRDYAKILTESDVFDEDFDKGRYDVLVEQLEKKMAGDSGGRLYEK